MILGLLLWAPVIGKAAPTEERISEGALRQIQALQAEKDSRSPVHLKLDSQFVYKLKQNRKQTIATGVTGLQPNLEVEPDGRVQVDISAEVSQDLLNQIVSGGGTVIHSAPEYHSIRAQVPLEQLEKLAERKKVKFIRRASHLSFNTGSVTSQGDATQLAAFVRTNYGFTGAGIKVGVISDGITYLSTSQASGNLDSVTVLPGQAGPAGKAEGTAMMEIVHDLAPGAQLYFATAFSSEANFAQNILNLRSNGCQIIVDDVMYSSESPFQDGIIAQAVNTVTANGALYFSSAGNEGNFKYGAGTWEGDFVDSGQTLAGHTGTIHSFGGTNYNPVVSSGNWLDLFWADPLGGSSNDYDLFVLSSDGSQVVYASTNPQTGTQDPFEEISAAFMGARIVIVKKSGAARYLHLNYYRGQLATTTIGTTRGHSTATNAISVAAAGITNSYPNPFVAGTNTHVEPYSSDGPRRVFFQANGTPITPGNFSSTGGAVRQKPDVTAADSVSVSVPGFSPFNGTSAAAPHAAAIAALVLSGDPALNADQLRAIVTNAVLDIEAPGSDINSGNGILMADRAAGLIPKPFVFAGTPVFLNESIPNGALDPGEVVTVSLPLRNMGFAATTNLVATLLNTNGVTFASAAQTYGVIAGQGSTATQAFSFVATGSCGGLVIATLQLQDGSANLGTVRFVFNLGIARTPLSENFDNVTAPWVPASWTVTASGGGAVWQTATNWSDSGSNSMRLISSGSGDSSLISPPFKISTTSAQIRFTQFQHIVTYYAAGVLEISTNGGPFVDILDIGATFVTNGYNRLLGVSDPSPLAGRPVWSSDAGRLQTIVNLPASAAGQTLRLRFRFVDPGLFFCYLCPGPEFGWSVDSIVCNEGTACGGASPNNVSLTSTSSSSHVYLTGNLDFTLRVSNSGPDPATGVTVTNLLPAGFTLNSWTASSDVSLVSTGGNTMIFSITNLASGETKTITLSGAGNSVGMLSNVTTTARSDGGSVALSNATAVATVVLPGVVISDSSLYEADADTTNAAFIVWLTAPIATNVSVQFATTDSTAVAGLDYIGTNGTLTFPPGVFSQTLSVRVLSDSLYESDESFLVTLSALTNCVPVRTIGTGLIGNDDNPPDFSISPTNVIIEKPETGTTNVIFNVRLSAASGRPMAVSVGAPGKTAVPGRDYWLADASMVTFAPGETNKTIVVVVTNHASVKPSQDFEVDLQADGTHIANGSAVCTIVTAPPGKLDHFVWNPVASPKTNGLPFSITISARDYNEALATNFNAAAILNGFYVGGYRTNALFENVDTENPNSIGPETYGYSFTPATNLLATHLRAYLSYYDPSYPIKASLWTDSGVLLATRSLNSINAPNWIESPLNPPIELKAGHTYRASAYFGYLTGYGKQTVLPADSPDIAFIQTYYSDQDAFPTTLLGTNSPYVPLVDVRCTAGITTPIGITPGSSANFTNGAWTGAVRVQSPGTNVALMASDANGHWGISSSFNVNQFVLPSLMLSQVKVAAGNIQFNWNAVPNLYYQVQYKTNLSQATWQNLSVPILATNSTMLWSALIGPDPQRFYRLQASLTAPPPMLEARVSSGAIQLGWEAVIGGVYQVQYKTNLTQASWLNLGSPIVATNSATLLQTPIGPEPCHFYRLLASP